MSCNGFSSPIEILIVSLLQLVSSSTGRKVDDPELLEAIRLTIINNMMEYHPVKTSIKLLSISCLIQYLLRDSYIAASSYCIFSGAGI